MLDHLELDKILFLDIETVPAVYRYADLDPDLQELWNKKAKSFRSEELTPEESYEKAGIYAEFGKIVCISAGFIHEDEQGVRNFRMSSFYGDDEKALLSEFAALLNRSFHGPAHLLCGHNAKEFDFPYLARRMLLNQVELPALLDIAGKKPWEVAHLDTLELWKFGDRKNYTSLDLLARIFGIPTPKEDIDGSEVSRVYWEENDLERIVSYCQRDVLTVAQLLLSFRGEPLIAEDNVTVV